MKQDPMNIYISNCTKSVCKNCGKRIYFSESNQTWYHHETASSLCYPWMHAEPIPSEWHDDWF